MKLLCLIAANLSLVSLGKLAADDETKAVLGPPLHIEMQVVTLPRQLALPLIDDLRDRRKVEAAYASLQGLLAKGTATLIAWPILECRSGERARSEEIEDMRYPAEYTPPVARYITPCELPTEPKPDFKPGLAIYSPTATAFESRDTGVTLEVEGTVSDDGKSIRLDLQPRRIRLKEFQKIRVETEGAGAVVVEQPLFVVHQITSSMTLMDGERRLIAIFRDDDAPDSFELFLLKAAVAK